MSLISLLIFAFIGFFVLKGVLKGLIAEVLGMASVIFSVFIAFFYFEPLAKVVAKYIHFLPYYLMPLVAFLFIMVITYIAGILLIKLLTKMVQSLALGWANRILGGAVGFLKGALFASLIVFVLSFMLPGSTYKSLKSKHVAFRVVEPIVPMFYEIIANKKFQFNSPDFIKDWYEKINNKVDEVKDKAPELPQAMNGELLRGESHTA